MARAKGRCAGCGWDDPSVRRVREHVAQCPDYLELYRTDTAAALDPEAEQARFESEEAREALRDFKMERHLRIKAQLQQHAAERQVRDQQRWKGVRAQTAVLVEIPEGGRLSPAGVSQAQRKLSQELCKPQQAQALAGA